MYEILKPKVDFVFKRIFTTEGNKDVLINFLNSVFESANVEKIRDVQVLNPFIGRESVQDKLSILDIHARTESGTLINVEIQLLNQQDINKRTLYYWSRMYSGQLERGEQYRKLNKTITINILDVVHIQGGDQRCLNTFHLRNDRNHEILMDDIEIHFIELPKVDVETLEEDQLNRWISFLRSTNREEMKAIAVHDPMIHKALDTLTYLSQDEDARRMYEARERALHDEASNREGFREEGRREGKREGKLQATGDIARKLLERGMSVEQVMSITELTEREVRELNHRTQ